MTCVSLCGHIDVESFVTSISCSGSICSLVKCKYHNRTIRFFFCRTELFAVAELRCTNPQTEGPRDASSPVINVYPLLMCMACEPVHYTCINRRVFHSKSHSAQQAHDVVVVVVANVWN